MILIVVFALDDTAWSGRHDHLREVTSEDILSAIDGLAGHEHHHAISVIRSLFRHCKKNRTIFRDPAARLRVGEHASDSVPGARRDAGLPAAPQRRSVVPRITDAIIAEGRYQLVQAPDHAETHAWHVLVGGRLVGLVRPTWRGERSRPGWEPVDTAGTALPATGIGRVTSAGNARTHDAAAVSLLRALQRQQKQERRKATR